MSYFMTVSGAIKAADVPPPGKLVPASQAQTYIARLEPSLSKLDGAPVYLIDDGETGTSDDLVMDAKEAIWEQRPLEHLPFIVLLERCLKNGWPFRVWLADNHPEAHTLNVARISDTKSAIAALERGGVCWLSSRGDR